jgi:CII-binding regulator of phage lambda lysogenization HflD
LQNQWNHTKTELNKARDDVHEIWGKLTNASEANAQLEEKLRVETREKYHFKNKFENVESTLFWEHRNNAAAQERIKEQHQWVIIARNQEARLGQLEQWFTTNKDSQQIMNFKNEVMPYENAILNLYQKLVTYTVPGAEPVNKAAVIKSLDELITGLNNAYSNIANPIIGRILIEGDQLSNYGQTQRLFWPDNNTAPTKMLNVNRETFIFGPNV